MGRAASAIVSCLIGVSPDSAGATLWRSLPQSQPLTKFTGVRQIGETMLAKRRCPHTGVVNFFWHREPFMAVGSITETGQSSGCVWRSYVGEEAAGVASDMASAERRLAGLLQSAIREPATSTLAQQTPHRVLARSEGVAVR
jgi:hypothetical protein